MVLAVSSRLVRFGGFVGFENLIPETRAGLVGTFKRSLKWTELGCELRRELISKFSHRGTWVAWLPVDERQSLSFLRLTDDFQYRTTTVAKDEAVGMAALLKIKDADLTKLPTMELIYQYVDLPDDLIFAAGPRLFSPGFRWAPASYLNKVAGPSFITKTLGNLSPNGFIVEKQEMIFDCPLHLSSAVRVQGG